MTCDSGGGGVGGSMLVVRALLVLEFFWCW